MPFKGDMRLGGPHDNEARLNGTSDVEGVPEAGILIRSQRITYEVGQGGQEASYYISGNPTQFFTSSQTAVVDYLTDGLGGEVINWSSARDVQYVAEGTIIYADGYSGYTYVEIGGNQYESGTYVADISFGTGGTVVSSNQRNTYTTGPIYSGSETVYAYYQSQQFSVGTQTRTFSHDGNGGYTESVSDQNFAPQYYEVGSFTAYTQMYVSELSNNYNNGTYTQYVVSDGNGGVELGSSGEVSYYMSGDEFANDGSYSYRHNGTGGYYVESLNSGGSTSPTYINIGGTDYQNGTYDSGTGSTSYYSYGEYITYYDGLNYYHDGNGGSFTT